MMQLAFVLYKYFPYGGLQRDFLRIALECQRRGHSIRVYTITWQGDIPEGFDVRIAPIKAWANHRRNAKFSDWVNKEIARQSVDVVIGFNKMPNLDVYYAADICYEDLAQTQRSWLYRFGSRYKHFSVFERAVFARESKTKLLMISQAEQALFEQYYQTPKERFYQLPPGIARDRKAPDNAEQIRQTFREEFNLSDNDLCLLQVGSGFKTKGVDRSVKALASLPEALRKRTHFIIVGQDNPTRFLRQIQSLGLSQQVQILKGRDDIPRFLLGADVLIHPAYKENTGTVLLEALVAGLPVLCTDICGYSTYIQQADCGKVIPSPFQQGVLNSTLQDMLEDSSQRQQWSKNALAYAEHADLYSMPERAADIILEQA